MGGCVTGFATASGTTGTDQREFMNTNKINYRVNNKPNKKKRSLIRLGVEPGMAYAWSRSRMGGWAIAQSPILGTTITLSRLKRRGYESLLDYYQKVSPLLKHYPLFPMI